MKRESAWRQSFAIDTFNVWAVTLRVEVGKSRSDGDDL
jgi:hypothetical protein